MTPPRSSARPPGRPKKPKGQRKEKRVQILVREALLALWDEAVGVGGDINSRNQLIEKAVNQYIEAELRRGWTPAGDLARQAAGEILHRKFDRSGF